MDEVPAITSLPDDPAFLKQMVVRERQAHDAAVGQRDQWKQKHDQVQQRHDALHQQHEQLQVKFQHVEMEKQKIEIEKLRLEMQLLRLKKWYYGPRADRLTTASEVSQMLLEFAADLEERPVERADLPEESKTENAGTIRRVRRGRRNLSAFDHLPVSRNVHDLAEDEKLCPCCGKLRQRIGAESSWQIEFIPGRFERIEHVRIKYACKHCEHNADSPQIELADKPTAPIEKGMAGPGLLAYVITSKYADYLPLYRLENIFERNGFEIDRATQSIWCRDVAEMIKPLYDLMVSRVLASHVICTDDTVMPMLRSRNPGAPGLAPQKTKQARMWVYIGDGDHPYNIFDFTLGRSRDGPAKFLSQYQQTLLADAYGGYNGVVVGNDITRAGCWAHARRKFVEAEKTQPAIATEAVGIIRQLYAIEHQAREMTLEDRLRLRQSQSQPILTKLRDRLWAWKDQLLPKHPMAEAVNYTLNQWNELNVFATDGAVPIDNNISERDIKRVVLNRKNSLFVGNERGGQTAAILSSLTSTCKRHDIDPQHYLTQLLTNLAATPISQLPAWLPDQWKHNRTTAPAPNGV